MKQIFKTVAVIALAAFAASCAKERLAAPSGEETLVSFTVSAPVLQTRAIADGNTVDKVACCVYDSEGNYVPGTETTPISQTVTMTSGKADFKVRLVTGQTYSFLFWAYNDSGNHYTLDKDAKTVKVNNYTTASNDESRDAFYRYIASKKITGAVNETVELYRPFAQLNFGVEQDDITAAEAAEIEVKQSKVTLTNLANVLNLVDGSVSGEVSAAFTLADCPEETLKVKVTDASGVSTTKEYGYVAMNYILVGKGDRTLTDTKLTIAKEDGTEINTLDMTAVPLRGNYRTNVLGNLFTSQVITNIEVVSAFEEPDINKEFVSVTAESIENANALIEANSESDIIEVKFAAKPEDIAQKAILTSKVKESGTLNIEVSAETAEGSTLYVGDYASEDVQTTMPLDESAKTAAVNITIPEGTKIEKIIINASTKTVSVNGVVLGDGEYSIEELDAITSSSTLIIAKGQSVKKLVFRQGGLEIHGTVGEVEIPEDHGDVIVRECENINDDVYAVLKPYIATGYVSIQNEDKSWNIFAPIEMNGVKYATLKDAVKAAGTEETTITILHDIDIPSNVTIDGKKIILNTNGCTITPSAAENSRAIIVDNNGELTVIGGGKFIKGGYTGDNGASLNLYSGKMTVGDVYLEGPNTCVSVSGGTAVINDAQMKALDGGACVNCIGGEVDVNGISFSCEGEDPDGPGACWAESGGIIRIWDGEFEAAPLNTISHELETEGANYCLFDYREYDGVYNSIWGRKMVKGQIIVYGGKFKAFNPAENFAGSSYVAEGYQSVQDGDYWVVSKKSE